jgi:hypothetical protein
MTGAVTATVFESFSLPEKCTEYDLSTGRLTENSWVSKEIIRHAFNCVQQKND